MSDILSFEKTEKRKMYLVNDPKYLALKNDLLCLKIEENFVCKPKRSSANYGLKKQGTLKKASQN